MSVLTQTDFYKTGHRMQYPPGTELVYSNFTPRSSKLFKAKDFDNKIVWFGLQAFIQDYLIDEWNRDFFTQPKATVVAKYKRRLDTSLGPDAVAVDHIEALHDLGYLPLEILSLKEGSRVNIGIPVFTVMNTMPEFFWLTNFLETVMSCELWKPATAATIAYQYKKLLTKYAIETGGDVNFVPLQGHDFSFRGMSTRHDAKMTGMGHLLSFVGTDTIPAIDAAEQYYFANAEKELLGCSVPATEHSVMCMGGMEDEVGTFKRLIKDVYPKGIISIVSDTWNFWNVVGKDGILAQLKDIVLARQPDALGLNKVVIRPDSGDPVEIICGNAEAAVDSPEYKGAIECLWDIFGGTVNEKGYKVLDPHIGLIYGDSITLERAEAILQRLKEKGFCSTNVVFGIGSYTYQYVTRDTFGFAMKATAGKINGKYVAIQKDPITDKGSKKSACGFLRVEKENGNYILKQNVHINNTLGGEMVPVLYNGVLMNQQSFSEIRARLLEE